MKQKEVYEEEEVDDLPQGPLWTKRLSNKRPPSLTKGLFIPLVPDESFDAVVSGPRTASSSGDQAPQAPDEGNSTRVGSASSNRSGRSGNGACPQVVKKALGSGQQGTVSYYMRGRNDPAHSYTKVTAILQDGEIHRQGKRYASIKEFLHDVRAQASDNPDTPTQMAPLAYLPAAEAELVGEEPSPTITPPTLSLPQWNPKWGPENDEDDKEEDTGSTFARPWLGSSASLSTAENRGEDKEEEDGVPPTPKSGSGGKKPNSWSAGDSERLHLWQIVQGSSKIATRVDGNPAKLKVPTLTRVLDPITPVAQPGGAELWDS